ncbi:MAG TPA: hypothetical protein VF062_26150 [Candidatus Limnocylindrales bacterium]
MHTESVFGILVIRSDDSRAHVYRDIKQLLSSLPVGAAEDPAGTEFFSTAGHRLAPVFDREWRLQDLVQLSDCAEPDAVLQRLQMTVERMKSFLASNGSLAEEAGLRVEDGLRRLPSLRSATLESALQAWASVLGHGQGSHAADPWHNFWVHRIF